jgi:hypothetical protein
MVHFDWYGAFDIRTTQKPDIVSGFTSLDRFIIKKIFYLLYNGLGQKLKGSHLVFTIQKPDKKVTKQDKKFGLRMVGHLFTI